MLQIGDKVKLVPLTEDEFELFDKLLGEVETHEDYIYNQYVGIIIDEGKESTYEIYQVEFANNDKHWFLGEHLEISSICDNTPLTKVRSCKECIHKTPWDVCMKFYRDVDPLKNICKEFKEVIE